MPDEDKDIVVDESDNAEQTAQTEEKEQVDVKTLIAQKTHWRDKAKKLEEELKQAKTQSVAEAPKTTTASNDDEWKRRIEFTVTHKEYDSEDIEYALAISKGLGVDLSKAVEHPLFKTHFSAKQETRAKEGTTPAASRSPKVSPPKPISEMSDEEHRAYFNKIVNG